MGRLEDKYFFNSLNLKNELKPYEFHIHTNYTDGTSSIEDLILESINRNLELIIFSEHIEPWFVKSKDWFMNYVDEINFFKKKYQGQINIKIGVEAPAVDFDGNIDVSSEMDEHCEYILGAAHRYPGIEGRKISDLSSEEAIDLEYRTLLGLAGNKRIDALAHLGGTCYKYCSGFPNSLVIEVMKKANINGVAIEVNHVYNQPIDTFIDLCLKTSSRIVLGSNVHKKEDLGAVYFNLKKNGY